MERLFEGLEFPDFMVDFTGIDFGAGIGGVKDTVQNVIDDTIDKTGDTVKRQIPFYDTYKNIQENVDRGAGIVKDWLFPMGMT